MNKKIKELKDEMYASEEWKSGNTDAAVDNYLKKIHDEVPLHDYYDYQVWCIDNMYNGKRHVWLIVREAYPEFKLSDFEEWWAKDLEEWEKLNGFI